MILWPPSAASLSPSHQTGHVLENGVEGEGMDCSKRKQKERREEGEGKGGQGGVC